MHHFSVALKIAESMKWWEAMSIVMSSIGGIHLSANRFDDALIIIKQNLKLTIEHNMPLRTAVVYGSYMVFYGRQKRLEDSLKYSDKQLSYLRSQSPGLPLRTALINRGLTLIELKRYKEAIAALDESLALKDEVPAVLQTGSALRAKAELHLKSNRLPEALNQIAEALLFAQSSTVETEVEGLYEMKASILASQGNWSEAVIAFNHYREAKTKTALKNRIDKLEEVRTMMKIDLLEKDIDYNRLKNVDLRSALSELRVSQDRLMIQARMQNVGKFVAKKAQELELPLRKIKNKLLDLEIGADKEIRQLKPRFIEIGLLGRIIDQEVKTMIGTYDMQ